MISLFFSYCKERTPFRFPMILLLLVTVIWWLQDLPWQSMTYILLLSSACVLTCTILDFLTDLRTCRRIRELTLQAENGLFLPPLPAKDEDGRNEEKKNEGDKNKGGLEQTGVPAGGKDEQWIHLVRLWQQRSKEEKERSREEKQKNSRYYTLWSHQIKTPVSAMNLLLQEDQVDRQAMEQELLKAEQYVDMALQYQRLDQAGRDLVLKEYSLDSLVKKAVRQCAPIFIYNKTAVHLEPLKGAVLTDEKWFLFVLEQILCNAIKYTRQGDIRIYVTGSEHMAASGDWAGSELVIEDNGIGIRREDIPRVFEWGYTGYNGRQEKRSTGIGLFLCRQAMEMLGQTIRIDSREGEGTRVYLGLSGSLSKM